MPAEQHSPMNLGQVAFALRLYWMVAALVLGLVMTLLAPRLVDRVTRAMVERPGASLGWGILVAILTPIVAVLVMVTIIGIPVGLITLALWALAVLLSGVFAGIAGGRWFVDRINWRRGSLLWATCIGVPVSVVLFSLPLLGALLALLGGWWALGGLALNLKAARR
jgi:hypothetical protein